MSVSSVGIPEFKGWRAFLWPVHNYELKKLISMLLIFFLISFDYNILHTMKDSLVITAKASGAEVIPFIKVWVMFPSAIIMTFLFTRLSNRLSMETVVYAMITVFLSYFALFILVLYPYRSFLHPNESADALQNLLPLGFKGLIAMYRNWTLTLFYVMSELWSNIIVSMLFWGFANQVTRISEAKRFYGLFGIGANVAGIFAGQASVYLSKISYNSYLPFGNDAWEQSVFILLSIVIVAGIAAMAIFRWMNKVVLTDPQYYDPEEAIKEGNGKVRLSIRDSFKFLLKSKYLLGIATVVTAYNLVINLVEVIWKHEVHSLYSNPAEFNLYMNQVTTITGVFATLTALFISGNSIRKFGWTFTAMLTPGILLVTSIGFFFFFFMKEFSGDLVIPMLGTSPLMIVVFFGSTQNILSRAAKYSVFDATKEMAFVPLTSEYKRKGKAAIDGVCSRLGKSGGSLIHTSLLLVFSTLNSSAPYVAGFLLGTISIWMFAVRLLGKRFSDLTAPQQLHGSIVIESPILENPVLLTEGEGVLKPQQAM